MSTIVVGFWEEKKMVHFVTQNSKMVQNRFRMNTTKSLKAMHGKQSKKDTISTRLEFKEKQP